MSLKKSKPLPLLHKTIGKVLKKWKIKDLPHLVIGAKSIWSKAERKWLYQRTRHLAAKVTVMSDIELAHDGKFKGSHGILLLAGTGSIALGRGRNGKIARAGGHGPKKGDEGSGYWIGKNYMKQILEKSGTISVQKTAALAPEVIKKASAGDSKCRHLIAEAHSHLVFLVISIWEKLGEKNLPVELAGGLFENDYFREKFLNLLRTADSAF